MFGLSRVAVEVCRASDIADGIVGGCGSLAERQDVRRATTETIVFVSRDMAVRVSLSDQISRFVVAVLSPLI